MKHFGEAELGTRFSVPATDPGPGDAGPSLSLSPRTRGGWRALVERQSGSPFMGALRAPAAAVLSPRTRAPDGDPDPRSRVRLAPWSRSSGSPSSAFALRASARQARPHQKGRRRVLTVLRASLWQPVVVPADGLTRELPDDPGCDIPEPAGAASSLPQQDASSCAPSLSEDTIIIRSV